MACFLIWMFAGHWERAKNLTMIWSAQTESLEKSRRCTLKDGVFAMRLALTLIISCLEVNIFARILQIVFKLTFQMLMLTRLLIVTRVVLQDLDRKEVFFQRSERSISGRVQARLIKFNSSIS